MYSLHLSRPIAVLVAIASVAPFLSPLVFFLGDRSLFDLVPKVGWWIFLGGINLLLWWTILVYKVVSMYLSMTYVLTASGSIKHGGVKGGMYGSTRRIIASALGGADLVKRVPFKPSTATIVVLSSLVGLVGSLSIDSLIELALSTRFPNPPFVNSLVFIFGAGGALVLISPFIETMMMALVLEPLRKRFGEWKALPVISSFIWAFLHGIVNGFLQFLAIAWLFWILSNLYLYVRREHTWAHTCKTVFAAHALNNFMAFCLIGLRHCIG